MKLHNEITEWKRQQKAKSETGQLQTLSNQA